MASEAEIQALQRNVAAIKERLDYIEEHLVQMSKAGVGVGYAPSTSNIPPEVLELARAGKRLDAVAKYRELTNATLDQTLSQGSDRAGHISVLSSGGPPTLPTLVGSAPRPCT